MKRRGNDGGAPSGMYPCKGGGPNDYIYLMPATSQMWDALCAVIGRVDLLDDERLVDEQGRRKHAPEIAEAISEWTVQRDKFEAMHELAQAGIPTSAVYDTADLFRDPHLHERGFIHEVEHPVEGKVTLFGQPYRLSDSSVEIKPAPTLGQHTAEVLGADLGLGETEIEALRSAGAIR